MTLSRFLRDYLYIALGGNRRGVGSPLRQSASSRCSWAGCGTARRGRSCCGAPCMAPSSRSITAGARCALASRRARRGSTASACAIGAALTFVAVFGAWTIFRADDLPSAIRIVRGLAGTQRPLASAVGARGDRRSRALDRAGSLRSVVHRPMDRRSLRRLDADLPTGMARGRSAGVLVSKAQLDLDRRVARHRVARAQHAADHGARGGVHRRPCRSRPFPRALTWAISRRWAVASALLLAASLTSMTRVSEFLYFQF